jgi:hypothetical protein
MGTGKGAWEFLRWKDDLEAVGSGLQAYLELAFARNLLWEIRHQDGGRGQRQGYEAWGEEVKGGSGVR